MIYQYLYARSNEGYRQLNRWSGNPFRQEDMADMEALRSYNLSVGVLSGAYPECYYYYRSISLTGSNGIVGKTSYVPQGSSRYSGDRETSFVHKYIFTEDDFEKIIREPEYMFNIKVFCSKVEDTASYDDKDQDIFATPQSVTPEQMQELIKDMNISEEDFVQLLYALIDASSHLGKRVYIPLPSNDKYGTDKAMQFCERLLICLPDYIVAKCGFITYTNTFHNATTNNIPSSISLVFFVPTESNITKLKSVCEEHYLFDKSSGYTTRFHMNQVTYSFLNLIKDKVLYGIDNEELTEYYRKSIQKISQDTPCTPEYLSYLKLFYEYDNSIRQGSNSKPINNEELTQIFQCFKENELALTNTIKDDIEGFISELLGCLELEHLSLELLSQLYGLLSQIDENIISWICSHMLDNPLFLLKNECSNKEMLSELYHTFYSTPGYYEIAADIIYQNISIRTQSENQNNMERIIQLFQAIDKLYINYDGLVKSREFITKIKEYLLEILFKSGKLKNYEDINTLIDNVRLFIKEHQGCEEYQIALDEMLESAIEKIDLIDKTSLTQISTWDKDLLQNLSSKKSKDLLYRLRLQEWEDLFTSAGNLEQILNKLISMKFEELLSVIEDLLPFMYNMEENYKERFRELKQQFLQYHGYVIIMMLSSKISDYIKQLSCTICNDVLLCEGLRGMSELYHYVRTILDKSRNSNPYVNRDLMTLQNLFQGSLYYREYLIKISPKDKDYKDNKLFLQELHIPEYLYEEDYKRKTSTFQDSDKKAKGFLKHKKK